MNAETEERVRVHGEKIKRLFNLNPETDPVKLCRQLRRIEAKVSAVAVQLCNGPEMAPSEQETRLAACRKRLERVLGLKGPAVFFNLDPRGYALKIDNEREDYQERIRSVGLHTDWGGYGIVAPDLSKGD